MTQHQSTKANAGFKIPLYLKHIKSICGGHLNILIDKGTYYDKRVLAIPF